MKFLFNHFLYEPLYNILVFLINIVPSSEIGLAVIVLTIIVKIILYPLSASSIRTQIKMKDIEGELKKLQQDFKENKEEQAKKMLELYRKHKVNPFSGVLLIFIQIPVILALYFVFSNAGFPNINTEILYSFIKVPENINMMFLGFIDLAQNKNVLIAVFAGLTQYFQTRIVMSSQQNQTHQSEALENFMKSMQFQMKFIFPIITLAISYGLISVVGLYWIVSNLFAIAQEIYIKKKIRIPLENQKRIQN